MKVRCINDSYCTAYVRQRDPDAHANLNLWPGMVDVIERPELAHGDVILVDGGCGYEFDIPDHPAFWDVTLDPSGLNVVQYHAEPTCPRCGAVADHVLQTPPEPVPFDGLDTRSRIESVLIAHALATNPELHDLPPERRDLIARMLALGISGGADAGYTNKTEGAVALSAATAKTIVGYKSHANHGESWIGYEVGFDGVTASAVPVLVELCYCTWGANSPGTNSTSTTINQKYGRVITNSGTSGKTWSTEPTTITVLEEFLLTPNGGLVVMKEPLGTELDCAVSEGFVIRCTAPATVNVRASQLHRRC